MGRVRHRAARDTTLSLLGANALSENDRLLIEKFLQTGYTLFPGRCSSSWPFVQTDKGFTIEHFQTVEQGILNLVKQRLNMPSFDLKRLPELTDDQNRIIHISHSGIAALTGLPGTGKSHVVRTLSNHYNTLILAPTGRAALKVNGRTVHSYATLPFVDDDEEIDPIDRFFNTWSFKTSEYAEIDLMIIDECSMMDSWLMYQALLIGRGAKFILLVGDPLQLPPVGPGSPFSDILPLIPRLHLTKILRQEDQSGIPKLCADIANEEPLSDHYDNVIFGNFDYREFKWGEDFQCITPYREECFRISSIVRPLVNKNRPESGRMFAVGDKVLITKNFRKRHELYCNGHLDYVVGTDRAKGYRLKYIDQWSADLEEHAQLGYAITIHKSQGSEWPDVLLSIPTFSSFVTKRMLYTAASRAKRRLFIHSSPEVLRRIVQNRDIERGTVLKSLTS